LLTRDGKTAVAPLYDAMSTLVYPNVCGRMAMEIGGQYEFGDVSRSSFADFARRCDINPKAVFSRLDALSDKLPQQVAALEQRMSDEGMPSPIYAKIRSVVERHIAQVRAEQTSRAVRETLKG